MQKKTGRRTLWELLSAEPSTDPGHFAPTVVRFIVKPLSRTLLRWLLHRLCCTELLDCKNCQFESQRVIWPAHKCHGVFRSFLDERGFAELAGSFELLEMKGLVFLLLTSLSVDGQISDKVRTISFNRADAEHCRVVTIEGRPMLQTVYGGTSVAVGLPASTGGLDFRVFVVVRQTGPGTAQVKPKDFSALYSDPAHTRFWFYDKAAKVDKSKVRQEAQESGIVAASAQGDPAMPGAVPTPGPEADKDRQARAQRMTNEDPSGPVRGQEEAREEKQSESLPGSIVTPDELYLRRSTLRQGSSAEGFVYFRKPKGSKLIIGSRDLLFEIDIPVNGVVFRFS
jgi:hypothetical protein